MIFSMTGYGRAELSLAQGRLEAEISSYNHRFKEYTLRVSKELAEVERDVRLWCERKLRRGKFSVNLSSRLADPSAVYRVNREVLLRYFFEVEKLRGELKLLQELRLEDLLLLPGVVEVEVGLDIDREELSRLCLELLERAYEDLLSMRRREGENLEGLIRGILRSMESNLRQTEERWQEVRGSAFSSLLEKLSSLASELSMDQMRLHMEAAILVDRWDIEEELGRLKSHLDQFYLILEDAKESAKGKRLDFLAQEMQREANTVASKVPDARIRHLTVEMRNLIESLREQLQNVE